MLGYMNPEAYARTLTTGHVWFYSRSKQRLWQKGEQSGNTLQVQQIRADCDNDTLLVKAVPAGPVCHTGADTCFFEENPQAAPLQQPGGAAGGAVQFLAELEQIIRSRREHPQPDSHTSQMFQKGLNKITQKFGEEAVELVIEAKDENDDRFRDETADLLYRLLTLLVAKDVSLQSVMEILQARHK